MRPYLGPATGTYTAMMISTIITGLEQPSAEDPAMKLVTPSDPTMSFLLYKMNGTQGTLNCSNGDFAGTCGLLMPYTMTNPLPQATRDTVQAWITEGAPNN